MGGNYTKSIYNQLMEVMEKLDSMEAEHKKDRKEITILTTEVKSLHKENASLREEVSVCVRKYLRRKRKSTDWKKKIAFCVMTMSG